MIKECIDTGRTVDDAIERACEKLGIPREEVEFEILDLPRKGFLGFGGNPAKVRVYKETPDEKPPVSAAPVKQTAPSPLQTAPTVPVVKAARGEAVVSDEVATTASATSSAPIAAPQVPKAPIDPQTIALIEGKAQAGAAYLKTVLGAMGLTDIVINVKRSGENAILALSGEGLGMIIGRRGETMDALQYLVSLAANRSGGSYTRITLDSGNYREKRERTLEALAKKLASTAVRTGRSSTLEPMNPYERRIIHSAVSMVEGAASSSIGEEPNRRVVISAANGQRTSSPRPPFDRNRDDRRGPRGPRRDGNGPRVPRTDAPAQVAEERVSQAEAPAPTTPVTPGENTSQRSVPNEAAGTPLYGKIELE